MEVLTVLDVNCKKNARDLSSQQKDILGENMDRLSDDKFTLSGLLVSPVKALVWNCFPWPITNLHRC